jgi:hypothetical protein
MVVVTKGSTNTVTVIGGPPTKGGPKGAQVTLDLLVKDNDVGLSTKTHIGSSGEKVSLKTSAKTGVVDQLKVDVGIGDWMGKPGDDDDLDFLICISGAKGGPAKAPFLSNKKANAVDFRCDINLNGFPVKAKLKSTSDKDLKLVKCLDANGDPAWGYLGTVADAKELLNFSFSTPWSGKEIAKLAIGVTDLDHDGYQGL